MAETWIVTPDNTSEFILVPASVDVETWQHSVVTGDGDWAALPTAAENADAVWDEVLTGASHNIATSAGKRLRQLSVVPFLEGTVVDATATTTVIETSLTGYGDNFFNDALFLVEITANVWQSRTVNSYTSSTGEFTVDEALISAPANGVNISVKVTHIHPITQIQSGLYS